jgi:uncharacterized protein YkwD
MWLSPTPSSLSRAASLLAWGAALASGCKPVVSRAPERAPAAAVAIATNDAGEEIVVRTNAERQKLGLAVLSRNAALMNAAQLQANQMAALNRMAHDLPGASYPSLSSRLDFVRYQMRASGENVAEGYPSPAAVVAGWMTSPGHRSNIVSTQFTQMGAGVATAQSGRKFYAQVFARPP